MKVNLVCLDCGIKIPWDKAVAVPEGYICNKCYRKALSPSWARNPYPQICRHCGAKIYSSIRPVKCPSCGKPWVAKNVFAYATKTKEGYKLSYKHKRHVSGEAKVGTLGVLLVAGLLIWLVVRYKPEGG